MPKVSIVIPAYNEEESLPILLESIRAQTFTDYEILVGVAPKTTDKTAEVAEAYGGRAVDGGDNPGRGRNNAAKLAAGEIILFLDADVVLPDRWFLQLTIGEFEKRKLGAATCKIDPISNKLVDKLFHLAFNQFMLMTSVFSPHAPGFCIFVRRDIHEQINGFDEEIKLAEDHDYVDRASKFGKFAILKSSKIPVSVRRFDRDGRMNIAMKYLLAELYMQTRGQIKSDIFNYTFGHDEETAKPEEIEKKMKTLANLAKKHAENLKREWETEIKRLRNRK